MFFKFSFEEKQIFSSIGRSFTPPQISGPATKKITFFAALCTYRMCFPWPGRTFVRCFGLKVIQINKKV